MFIGRRTELDLLTKQPGLFDAPFPVLAIMTGTPEWPRRS